MNFGLIRYVTGKITRMYGEGGKYYYCCDDDSRMYEVNEYRLPQTYSNNSVVEADIVQVNNVSIGNLSFNLGVLAPRYEVENMRVQAKDSSN
jgi:hypothetical protein